MASFLKRMLGSFSSRSNDASSAPSSRDAAVEESLRDPTVTNLSLFLDRIRQLELALSGAGIPMPPETPEYAAALREALAQPHEAILMPDVIVHVMSFLSPEEVLYTAQVCRAFRDVALSPMLWEDMVCMFLRRSLMCRQRS